VLGDLREGMVLGQHQPGIGLVVAQDDVEARLQPLDEVGLQQQRLGLGMGGHDLHGDGVVHHPPQPFVQAACLGVGIDALLEAFRLSDIQRLPARIEHAIHAGAGRHGQQRLLDHGDALGGGRGCRAGEGDAARIGRYAGVVHVWPRWG